MKTQVQNGYRLHSSKMHHDLLALCINHILEQGNLPILNLVLYYKGRMRV